MAQVFIGTPWPVMMLMLTLIAWRRGGRSVALFVIGALAYIALTGFWQQAMSTLALVSAATFISIALGLPIGIWCAKREGAYKVVRPILDVMQTLPSFVYLIPAIAFFSIGKPPAVLATVIFSTPPMIRLTVLGITQVQASVKEAALAYGTTDRQLLWKVELPLAIPSIMTGINQTILLSLSMSVVAALIGAGGLGYDVLFALQNVDPGRGILAGIAIAFCAMFDDGTLFRLGPSTFRWMCGDALAGEWLREQATAKGFNAQVRDVTESLNNVAVQGPRSREILADFIWTPDDQPKLAELK